MIFAILPVKNPRNAKQRLSGLLSAAQRERLARLLYEDTLAALCRAGGIDRLAVATSDAGIAELARRSGALVFQEDEQQSHSASADRACRLAMQMGAAAAMLVPIDVPLATAEDFERLAAAAGASRGLAIVPSVDGTGTNALVRTPPDAIESRFGPGSFQAHLEQARTKGLAVEVLRLPGLMFDIDTPEDVAELLQRAPHSRAASFLESACASR